MLKNGCKKLVVDNAKPRLAETNSVNNLQRFIKEK